MNHFKNHLLFLDIFWLSHCQSGHTFRSHPATVEWRQRTRLWRWFRWPPSGSSWSYPGTLRGKLALLHPREEKKNPLGRHIVNSSSGASSCQLCHYLDSRTKAACGLCCHPHTEISPCTTNQLEPSQSLLLMKAPLTVSSLDSLNSGRVNNHITGSPFWRFI